MTRPKLRVLLLEDDDDQRKTWTDLLRYWGFWVLPARTANEAIELAKRQYFQLAVLDKSMTVNDADNDEGLRVAQELIRGGGKRSIPVIMLTAYMPTPSDVAWWMAQAGGGVFDFVHKKEARRPDPNGTPRLLGALRAAEAILGLNTSLIIRGDSTLPAEAREDPVEWLSRRLRDILPAETGPDIDQSGLSVEVFDILANLFNQEDCDGIDLRQISRGRSGSVVLAAVPWRRAKGIDSEVREVASFLKIGSPSKMLRERNAATKVQDLIQGYRTARLIGSSQTKNIAGLRFQFIGTSSSVPKTLDEVYDESDTDTVISLIDDLFRFVLQLLHQPVSATSSRDVARVYRLPQTIADNLKPSFEAVLPFAKQCHRVGKFGQSGGEQMDTFVYDLHRVSFPADYTWSVTVHGDLHGGNVLVLDDRCWLIDLAHARSGPFLTDFVDLEAWLTWGMVANKDLTQAEELVHLTTTHDPLALSEVVSDHPSDKMRKAASVIATIRGAALRVALREWGQLKAQYAAALFFAAARYLRFCGPDEHARAMALLRAMNVYFGAAQGFFVDSS